LAHGEEASRRDEGEEMEYVKFGKPGLGVPRLCIGPLIRKALDLGIYSEA
jgi:hypothetical protein